LNYPIVLGDEKIGAAYGGILGIPVTMLIDRQGFVRARYEGGANLTKVKKDLDHLLHGLRSRSLWILSAGSLVYCESGTDANSGFDERERLFEPKLVGGIPPEAIISAAELSIAFDQMEERHTLFGG